MAVGAFALIVFWQILSVFMHEIVVASPVATFKALFRMSGSSYHLDSFLLTLKRLGMGIVIGCLAGFGLGIAAGLNRFVKDVLEPLSWVLMSIPPVIVTMIAMLWFGIGSFMVVFIASLLIAPFVYINTVKGMEMVDDRLIEMADVYGFSLFMKLRHVYLPAIVSPVLAGMTIVMGSGVRVVVLAELLGANDGVGFSVAAARSSLMIDELFAWAVATLIVAAFLEYAVLKPVQDYLLRWNR